MVRYLRSTQLVENGYLSKSETSGVGLEGNEERKESPAKENEEWNQKLC